MTRVHMSDAVNGIRTVRIWRNEDTPLPRRFEFTDTELVLLAGLVNNETPSSANPKYEYRDLMWRHGESEKLAEFAAEGWEPVCAHPRCKPHAPEDGIYWYALLRKAI